MKRILLLLLPGFVAGVAAAPVNDLFANRIDLGSAARVSTGGTTVGATLQTNENDLDSIGGASVWWKWTAPTSGWVTVDTGGSAIDTVLAVLADGPALKDTYIVGCNDESGDPAAAAGTSRVIFQATGGTEYHLAVHGFLGAQGQVSLSVHLGTPPPLRVDSVTLTPASVNVTAAGQSIQVDLAIVTEAPFAEGVLAVHKANFTGINEVPITAANRISGTATAGTYRVSVPVARHSTPGTWLLEMAVSDTLGREAVFGRGVSALFEYDHVLPDGAPGLFSVTNTGAIDANAPGLVSFGLSTSAANVTNAAVGLNFAFRVTDDLAGFGSGVLTLFTPSGEALAALPVTAAHRTAGTALDGTFTVPFLFPAKMPSGTWTATLLLRDATGNPSLFDGAVTGDDFPQGPASAELAVTGAPNGYWAWIYPRTAGQADAEPQGDADGDGIENLLEYAFGLSPNGPDSSLDAPFGYRHDENGLAMTFFRRRTVTASGVSYAPEFCADLQSAGAGGWQGGGVETVTPLDDRFERVRVVDPAGAGERRFGRLSVTLAE